MGISFAITQFSQLLNWPIDQPIDQVRQSMYRCVNHRPFYGVMCAVKDEPTVGFIEKQITNSPQISSENHHFSVCQLNLTSTAHKQHSLLIPQLK